MPERDQADDGAPGRASATTTSSWGFEIKWDGVRAILYVRGRPGPPRRAATCATITTQYPELRELGRALGSREVVLDGEIVALDEQGKPSFERLQRRMHVGSESGGAAPHEEPCRWST